MSYIYIIYHSEKSFIIYNPCLRKFHFLVKVPAKTSSSINISSYERSKGYVPMLSSPCFRRTSPCFPSIEANPANLFTCAKETQEEISEFVDHLIEIPTAWFCVNDGHGFNVQSVLQQKGFKIPEDISICSFDNGQLSQIATPKMTTVDIDLNYYGKKAVEQLSWRIKHKDEPMHEILLPTTLIVRESTAVHPVNSI